MYTFDIFYRLILTGTPIQNNLIEFWALVNWATSGNMLGTKANFKAQYVDPILAGQEPKVTLFFIIYSFVSKSQLSCVFDYKLYSCVPQNIDL